MIDAKAEDAAPGVPNPSSPTGSLVHPEKRQKRDEAKSERAAPNNQQAEAQVRDDDDDDDMGDDLVPEAQPTCARHDVSTVAKFRENVVHVYGLDFLQTEHMNEIFNQFDHKYIEWINDSSANIIFKNAGCARQALDSLSYPKAGDAPWRRTPDILVSGDSPPVFLQMRLATWDDHKTSRKCVPKVLPLAPMEKGRGGAGRLDKSRQAANGGSGGNGNTIVGVTRKGRPSVAEVDKRQKRIARFGTTETADATVAKTSDAAAQRVDLAATSSDGITRAAGGHGALGETIELTEDEMKRRQKRAKRFCDGEHGKETKTSVTEVDDDGKPEPIDGSTPALVAVPEAADVTASDAVGAVGAAGAVGEEVQATS